ncbi:hypothetical protein [Paraburkholderia sediminicola]|uniref:hypothetical protein n=1 Tax=Paraburkholderia sediminicola TaxID=458836 RepID=UPI0038B78755
MHKQRLEQMVTMLRGLPPEGEVKFNLEVWNCGTSACAVGHACVSPVFIKQGLKWDGIMRDPVFGGACGWRAVERFFDVIPDDAERLFADWRYTTGGKTTPNQVADRIAEFIGAQ